MDPPRDSLEMAEWRIRQANFSKFLNDRSAKRVSSNAWIMDQLNLRMMDPPSESLQMPEWWIRQDTLNADSAEEFRRKVWYVACRKRMSDSPYSVILSRHSLFDFCDLIPKKKRDFFNGNNERKTLIIINDDVHHPVFTDEWTCKYCKWYEISF